jgi:hypothetical protein
MLKQLPRGVLCAGLFFCTSSGCILVGYADPVALLYPTFTGEQQIMTMEKKLKEMQQPQPPKQ